MSLNQYSSEFKFNVYEQEDAYYFLSSIINSLTSDKQSNELYECFIMEILEVTTSCCSNIFETKKKIFTSLLLPTTDDYSISYSLKNYFADKVSSDSKSSCKCPTNCTKNETIKNFETVSKTFKILKPLNLLILYMKRILLKNGNIIWKPIQIQTSFNFKDVSSGTTSTLYSLKALNYINTKKLTEGHYRTYFLINDATQWIRFH